MAGVDGLLAAPRTTDAGWGVFPRAGVAGAVTRGDPMGEFCQIKKVDML